VIFERCEFAIWLCDPFVNGFGAQPALGFRLERDKIEFIIPSALLPLCAMDYYEITPIARI